MGKSWAWITLGHLSTVCKSQADPKNEKQYPEGSSCCIYLVVDRKALMLNHIAEKAIVKSPETQIKINHTQPIFWAETQIKIHHTQPIFWAAICIDSDLDLE